jgi:hypothetical protein
MPQISAKDVEQQIAALLSPHGLLPLGWFDESGRPGLLVGNVGSSLWSAFSRSDEFGDGQPDPMDRWTVAVLSTLKPCWDMEIRYPFGDPAWPFQDYARRAMRIGQSPIGLLIHPEYGLWTAFRAALIFNLEFDIPKMEVQPVPCDSCLDKPCLTACPVSAFSPGGYDYLSCKSHVAQSQGKRCFDGGCMARLDCPVGKQFIYYKEHQTFHMRAYI